MKIKEAKKLNVDTNKLTLFGSTNYIVQAFREKDEDGNVLSIMYDSYVPQKNTIYHGYNDLTETDLIEEMKETVERMKIAQKIMEDFITGKTDEFYYWEFEDEDYKKETLTK